MNQKRHRVHPLVRARARELRQPQTPAERTLWARLRDRQLHGLRFRRQHPLGRFIVDFCCPACKLVVEIDGDSHAEQAEYDADRTVWLAEQGYAVIRFTNHVVHGQLDAVLQGERGVTEDDTSMGEHLQVWMGSLLRPMTWKWHT